MQTSIGPSFCHCRSISTQNCDVTQTGILKSSLLIVRERPNGTCRHTTITGANYAGNLSYCQVFATDLETGHPWMKSTGARSSNSLQWLDCLIEHQDVVPVIAVRVTRLIRK